MKKVILFFCLLFLSIGVFATHIIGGSLTYVQVNDSTYVVTLKLDRDCRPSSVAFPSTVHIEVRSNDGATAYSDIIIPLGTVTPVAPLVPSCVVASPVCLEEGTYSKTVTNLYPTTGGYHLYFQYCCRNSTLMNIITPLTMGDTWYVHIPGTAMVTSNSSPQWLYPPPLFNCSGSNMSIDQSATDADGDSLVYSLYTPYSDGAPTFPSSVFTTGTVNWSSGYSANNPLQAFAPNSLTIDTNGILHGVPPTLGSFLAGIKCEEWRAGLKIGWILRDFQFNIASCPPVPVAAFNFNHLCSDSLITFNNTTTPSASNYFWDFGNTSTLSDTSQASNPSYTYSSLGTYQVTLITNPGTACADTATQNLTRAASDPSINGYASYSGGAINSGHAKLFLYTVGSAMPMIDSVELVSGNYAFSNVPPGDYLVWINPDTLMYSLVAPTYYDTVCVWDSATVIALDCGDSVIANVTMIEAPFISGGGGATGTVLEGSGFSRTPGDPIPRANIGLLADPSGSFLKHTTTNVNGAYAFSDLPSGCYTIYVDLPGLPMDSTYHFCITSNDTITDLNFYADSNHVYILDLSTSLMSDLEATVNLQIYPNPFSENTTVEFNLEKESLVEMEIYNLLGEKITLSSSEKRAAGLYKQQINMENTGIYFLKLRIGNEVIVKKIVHTK